MDLGTQGYTVPRRDQAGLHGAGRGLQRNFSIQSLAEEVLP